MDYSFYAIHWIQYENNKIKWTDDSLYCSINKPFNLDEVKQFIRTQVLKDAAAAVSIENVKQISKEKFEEFGGTGLN